jgi:hypothetical protein
VQTLSYAVSIESPWPAVVRLVALFGLPLGCVRLAELGQLAWQLFGNPSSAQFLGFTVVGIGFPSGIGGLLCIIGSVGLLRRHKSAGLVIAACWVLIGTSALGLIVHGFLFSYGSFRQSTGQPALMWGIQLLGTTTLTVMSALLPLMILMLLRKAMRDPQYRATLEQ